MTATRLPIEQLETFASEVLVAQGVPERDALIVAQRLVEADARGRTGHGLIRLPQYSRRIREGGYNLTPRIRLVSETPSSGLLDGDNGLGQVVMTRATRLAIDKALENGISMVGTVHSNHAGAGGVYTAMALDVGLGAIYCAVANGNAMAPTGGLEKLLGTNPLAVALPAGDEIPFQLDMATTVVSHGTIGVAAQEGGELEPGWVSDESGRWVTDPGNADAGYLEPIGGYKGAGLSLMVGLMAGVMTGAAFGRDVVPFRSDHTTPTNTGQLIIVFRPDLFVPADEYVAQMDVKLRELRDSMSRTGDPVRLPGERSASRQREAADSGVPVAEELILKLDTLARDVGARFRLAKA